jgi:hypothetical protein
LQLDKASAARAQLIGGRGGGENGSAVIGGSANSSFDGADGGEEGSDGPDWCDLEQLLDAFEKRTGRRAVYSICFY